MSKIEITLHNAFYHVSLVHVKRPPKCWFCAGHCRPWHNVVAQNDQEHKDRAGKALCNDCTRKVEYAREKTKHLPAEQWTLLVVDPLSGAIAAKKGDGSCA